MSKTPIPFKEGGKWKVDLRAWAPPGVKLGHHYTLGPDTLPDSEAQDLAWKRLIAVLGEAMTTPAPTAQLALAPGPAPDGGWGGPATFGGAIVPWKSSRRLKGGTPTAHLIEKEAKAVTREFGATPLAALCQPGGEKLLQQYALDLENGKFGHKYSGRTIRNRWIVIRQTLEYCASREREWLPYVPKFPEFPEKSKPRFDWIGEPAFRWVRARIYADCAPKVLRAVLKREGQITTDPELYVARRKVYLSWLFYTGVRTIDADTMTADLVSIDAGVYYREATKTRSQVEQYEMPLPLIDDLREYLAFVGREFFLEGEKIGGGRWSTVARVIGETAAPLDQVHLNPRKLRRSYARRMCELGYKLKQTADRMGHADLKMLHEIYARYPRPEGHAKSLWPRCKDTYTPSSPMPNKVLAFVRGGGGGDGDDSAS